MIVSRWLNLTAIVAFCLSPSLLGSALGANASATVDAQAIPGLVEKKPESGRFVETKQGFMVPYSVTIPGTKVEFTMQPIPGGTFQLGSPQSEAERSDDEGPQIKIQVAPFWIAQHEVTWAEYKTFMEIYEPLKSVQSLRALWQTNSEDPDVVAKQQAIKDIAADKKHLSKLLDAKVEGVDAITVPTPLYEPDITYESGEDPRQPAVTMSQYAAKQYTKWMAGITHTSYRLPTEAEWEYACRAGSTTAFHFGDDAEQLDEYAWFTDNSDATTQEVEQKKPNPWDLYDMHGNVSEWVIDAYDEAGYDHLDANQPHKAIEAIRRTEELFPRALRGGHWDDDADRCRSAARLASDDYEWYDTDPNFPKSPWWFTDFPAGAVGFRMVRPLAPMNDDEKTLFWEADAQNLIEDIANRLDEGRGVQENVDSDLPKSLQEAKEVDESLKSK